MLVDYRIKQYEQQRFIKELDRLPDWVRQLNQLNRELEQQNVSVHSAQLVI